MSNLQQTLCQLWKQATEAECDFLKGHGYIYVIVVEVGWGEYSEA